MSESQIIFCFSIYFPPRIFLGRINAAPGAGGTPGLRLVGLSFHRGRIHNSWVMNTYMRTLFRNSRVSIFHSRSEPILQRRLLKMMWQNHPFQAEYFNFLITHYLYLKPEGFKTESDNLVYYTGICTLWQVLFSNLFKHFSNHRTAFYS